MSKPIKKKYIVVAHCNSYGKPMYYCETKPNITSDYKKARVFESAQEARDFGRQYLECGGGDVYTLIIKEHKVVLDYKPVET